MIMRFCDNWVFMYSSDLVRFSPNISTYSPELYSLSLLWIVSAMTIKNNPKNSFVFAKLSSNVNRHLVLLRWVDPVKKLNESILYKCVPKTEDFQEACIRVFKFDEFTLFDACLFWLFPSPLGKRNAFAFQVYEEINLMQWRNIMVYWWWIDDNYEDDDYHNDYIVFSNEQKLT